MSISAIGFGEGLGVGVGGGVAVGATDAVGVALAGATDVADVAAVGDNVNVTRPAPASHATNKIASNAAKALILLG